MSTFKLTEIGPFSNQAITVIVAYIFAIGMSFVQSNYVTGLLWIFVLPIVTYDINCLTYGKCDSWSWVRVLLSITPLFIYILYSTFFGKPKQETQTVQYKRKRRQLEEQQEEKEEQE